MFYKIISDKDTKSKIYIPPGFSDTIPLIGMDSVSVHAGLRRHYADVIRDSGIEENKLKLSEDIVEYLNIPTDIEYQVKYDKEGIKIGPVIGFLMARTKGTLGSKRTDEMFNYTLLYPQIRGLFAAFSADEIDFANGLVKGYYYVPDSQNKAKMVWQERILPLPASIFSRTALPDELRLKIKEAVSNRFFNSFYFNKWDFWRMLSGFEEVREYLPHTGLLRSIRDVEDMLSQFGAVYLKPLNGTLGRGLIKVVKDGGRYSIKVKQDIYPKDIDSRVEAEKFLADIVRGHRYLMQQALRPVLINGAHMDFRVIMQKNHTKKWGCTGIIACVGNPGGITSNWGYEMSFEDVFTKYLNFSQEKLFRKKQEVINACKKVCEILDQSGENFGDLGFDVLIDESLKVWVLEVNKRHYHTVPLRINDFQTFYAVKTNTVKYVTALSGFDVY